MTSDRLAALLLRAENAAKAQGQRWWTESRVPAVDQDIDRLSGLSVRALPRSYVEFLRVTDGLLLNYSYDAPSLGKCDERLLIFGVADFGFIENIASLSPEGRFFPFAIVAGEEDVYLFDLARGTAEGEFVIVHGSLDDPRSWGAREPLADSFDDYLGRVVASLERGDGLGVEPDE